MTASLEVVLAQVRLLRDAERTIGEQNLPFETERARLRGEHVTCLRQLQDAQSSCYQDWQRPETNYSLFLNNLRECEIRATEVRDRVDAKAKGGPIPPFVPKSLLASWRHGSLSVGTTVTEWKDYVGSEVLYASPPGVGFPTVPVHDRPALSIPPGRMLLGVPTLPLLECTVGILFRFATGEPKLGVVLARVAEPPAAGMTFLACNGQNLIHGVYYGGRWITTKGEAIPADEPILVVYQYDSTGPGLRLRYCIDPNTTITENLGDASSPGIGVDRAAVPLSVGGPPIPGLDIAERSGSLQLYDLQVHAPRITDQEINTVAYRMFIDWIG